jgi:5-methylcytosine-specific restriction endonuclease McrA
VKKIPKTSELRQVARLARDAGHKVKPTANGGGWIVLAFSCGYRSDEPTKAGAKEFLRDLLPRLTADAATIRPQKQVLKAVPVNPASNDFLSSYAWRRVRMEALKKHGGRCQCCGAKPPTVVIHVDHIKPRKLFPDLALDVDNLQVLCVVCNHGKGNWDQTDWRSNAA